MDLATVTLWIKSEVWGDKWIRTKGAAEMLIKCQLGALGDLIREFGLKITVTLVPSQKNKADMLTWVKKAWLQEKKDMILVCCFREVRICTFLGRKELCIWWGKWIQTSQWKLLRRWWSCGTIASRHLVGRWSRDYHMCRLVFLCFFPRPRCFQIRGKRRWMRSSRWRLEFVWERRKSCQANFKKWRK